MATTMKLIAKQTLGSNSATFSLTSIPANHTDLLVMASVRTAKATTVWDTLKLRFNGASTDTSHSSRNLEGGGSSAQSNSFSYCMCGYAAAAGATSNTFTNLEIYIPNYANTTTNKSFSVTVAHEHNGSEAYINCLAGLWSSTSAIDAIEFVSLSASNFVTNSSWTLYGITKS